MGFLPSSLYTPAASLSAAMTAQEQQKSAAPVVAHSVLEPGHLAKAATFAAAAPAEKKIQMYSRVRRAPSGEWGCLARTNRGSTQMCARAEPQAALQCAARRKTRARRAHERVCARAPVDTPPPPPPPDSRRPTAAASRRPPARRAPQDFYVACSLGGIVACGLTHTMVTPLDVVKCNMQTDPKNYTGIAQAGAGPGWARLGWAGPTVQYT